LGSDHQRLSGVAILILDALLSRSPVAKREGGLIKEI
jgi:hypothetical protein